MLVLILILLTGLPILPLVVSPVSTGSVSSHGVTTRATKALVRQAMSLNYQQIQANQLQNMMMAEQIADRRANRALAIEQHPLDMAYRQAQIDAIKNGIDVRSGEYGISAANLLLNQEKFNYEQSRPQSTIGRNYEDVKRIGKDVYGAAKTGLSGFRRGVVNLFTRR